MKFRNEKIELGTRFYTFISEDEYRIVTFVKDNNNKSGQFMDEETFELETITEDKLFDKFTLLADNSLWIICNFKAKDEFKDSKEYKSTNIWIYNNDITKFVENFNLILFKCSNIEYHEKTGSVKKIIFEQLQK